MSRTSTAARLGRCRSCAVRSRRQRRRGSGRRRRPQPEDQRGPGLRRRARERVRAGRELRQAARAHGRRTADDARVPPLRDRPQEGERFCASISFSTAARGSQLGYQVRLATESWRERRITFDNAPRVSPRFVSSGRLRARAWKAVDITSLVGDERRRGESRADDGRSGRDRIRKPGEWHDRAPSRRRAGRRRQRQRQESDHRAAAALYSLGGFPIKG